MAFGCVLIFNIIFFIILCTAALGGICLVSALILGIIQLLRKQNGKLSKKWLHMLRIILTVIGLLAMLPFLMLLIIGS